MAGTALCGQAGVSNEIDSILEQGFTAAATGKYPELAKLGSEALRLSESAHDRHRTARALILVGSANYYQGRLSEAIPVLERAEREAADLGDVATEMQAKRVIGNTLRQLGRYDEALRTFQDWFRLNRHPAVREPEGPMVRTLSILYREMGDLEKAERTCRQALKLARGSGDRRFEAATLLSLGALMKDRKRYRDAIALHGEALRQAAAAQAGDLRAEILNSLGDAYRQVGEAEKAAGSLSAAVQLSRSLGYRGVEAQSTERLGEIELSLGQGEAAIQDFAHAASLYRENGDVPEKRFHAEQLWAQTARSLGRPDEALAHYREAIGLLERLERFTVPTETARAFPIAAGREIFEDAVDVLIELHRPAEAFELAERGRARAFLDMLNESKIDLRSTLSAQQRAREAALMRELAASRDPQAEADVLTALETFYLALRRSNPAYAGLKHPEVATADRVQSELTGSDTVFLEYMLAEKRSYAWAIAPDRIQLTILPPRKEIERLARAYRVNMTEGVTALTIGPSRRRKREQGRELYRLLIDPFALVIQRAKHILIGTDGELAYVPFEALRARDGRLLIEQCAISYSQSASASLELRALGPPAPSKTLLAFGDAEYGSGGSAEDSAAKGAPRWTQLPSTRDEILGISRLYPPQQRRLYLGADATKARLKQQNLREYRYLHFAVHAIADDDHPSRSGLVFSRNAEAPNEGVLRMEEIALMRSSAELVTLSACRTGVGHFLSGEGLMALSRAFFYGGAHMVIGTLWDVNDQSTAELMTDLYAGLKNGLRPEAALRQAKLRAIRGHADLWRDPHFWAPFVVLE